MNSKMKRILDFSTAFGPSIMESEVSKINHGRCQRHFVRSS